MTIMLDKSKPFGTTFGEDSANDMAFFQDGLWFNARGECNEKLPANAEVLAKRPQPAAKPPAAIPKTSALDGKPDTELYKMAVDLKGLLEESGEAVSYEPVIQNRQGNIDFIRQHAE